MMWQGDLASDLSGDVDFLFFKKIFLRHNPFINGPIS
jgi:hypothetical protein